MRTKRAHLTLFFVIIFSTHDASKGRTMNRPTVTLFAGLGLALLLTGCRSRQEASGDKYRKIGDPLHALMQYEEALKRGGVSKEFWTNYTTVNIAAMSLRSK